MSQVFYPVGQIYYAGKIGVWSQIIGSASVSSSGGEIIKLHSGEVQWRQRFLQGAEYINTEVHTSRNVNNEEPLTDQTQPHLFKLAPDYLHW